MYKRQILSSSAGLQSILEHLSTHQQADPKLISIITRLEAGDETISQYYKIHNGILFSRPSLYKEEWKVTIPTHIEKEIVFNYHVRYGHMGALKVVKALEESCHSKDINRKVRKYIRNCRICQLLKTNNEKREGQMIPITSQSKLEKVFLDICGPFPRSGGRHRYKYLIILMDHYTKFVKLYPANRATTNKVLDILTNQYFPTVGKSVSIITDHGTQFKGRRCV